MMPGDLEGLLAALASPDRPTRLAAIRRVNHVHQRPDLATVDALLEVSYQLWRLAEAYEIVNAVEPRRQALEKARLDGRIEERARRPAPAQAPTVPREDSWEEASDVGMRVYNALTRKGVEYHTKDQILAMNPVGILNFGRASFGELVASLERGNVPMSVLKQSRLWTAAPEPWRNYAQECLDKENFHDPRDAPDSMPDLPATDSP